MNSAAVDLAGLERAHEAFYAAVEALDIERLAELWAQRDDAWCTQPGWDTVVGWEAVRGSWEQVIATTEFIEFIVTDVRPRVLGDVGVVTCTEWVLERSGAGRGIGPGQAMVTNVFVPGAARRWRILGHHASAVLRRL